MRPIPRLAPLAFAILSAGCDGTSISFPPDGAVWRGREIPEWTGAPRLATTNSGDDTVSFISLDLPSPRVLGRFRVGNIPVELEGPHHLAASPDGQFLYVGLSNFVPGSGSGPHGAHGVGNVPGSLLKLRASDGVKVGEAFVDRNPGDVILSRDGRTAFVSHYDLLRLQSQVQKGLPEAEGHSGIAIIDTALMGRPPLYLTCATVHGMALSEDERTLYAACGQTDELAIVDLASREVKRVRVGPVQRRPLDPAYFPYALSRSPADGTLWISCTSSGDVRVYDPRTGLMDESRKVFVNGLPLFGAFLPDGKTLLLPHQGDDRLSVIDTLSAREIAVIDLSPAGCLNAHAVHVMPGGQTAYVVCEGDHRDRPGNVVAIDVDSRAVLGSAEVGIYPDAITLLPPAP